MGTMFPMLILSSLSLTSAEVPDRAAPANARLIVAGLTIETTIRWDASSEPDIAGYEIVYRETNAPFWENVVDVGAATKHTIDLSRDNWFFGVRAYDADGHRSLASFPGIGRD